MKVLVVNTGSSSLKYQLIDMETEQMIAKGNCERIGEDVSIFSHKNGAGDGFKKETKFDTHKDAMDAVLFELTKGEYSVISSLSEIDAVGHRIVQGGSIFKQSTLIDEDVIKKIDDLAVLAPLHNKAHVVGIRACQAALGKDVPQVAVFDTSFHQTMPPEAYIFPIPYEYYEKYAIRRYGAHGTSHRYVSAECARIMGKDIKDLKIITCHLGNGASITAVNGGKCVDTSMGLTPVDGIMMGTRTGSMDPSVLTYIGRLENMSPEDLDILCNKKSGLLGVSGVSNDSRIVVEGAENGNERCRLATNMQRYQITKTIGSYAAAMNGVDAIVFTAGLGENNPGLRLDVMNSLTYLGVKPDVKTNEEQAHCSENTRISAGDSKVAVYIIPTDEELVIARDTRDIVNAL